MDSNIIYVRHALFASLLLPALLFAGCIPADQRSHYHALSEQLAKVPDIDEAEKSLPALTYMQESTDLPKIDGNQSVMRSESLDLNLLIQAVLQQNPTIKTAKIAWKKSLKKYSQVTPFNDPMVTYQFAPATIFTGHRYGQTVTVAQRFEWPGKQALRGDTALAESEIFAENYATVQLRLKSACMQLFADYFAIQRALDINAEHLEIIKRLRQSAEAHYDSGHGSQQDPIQVDVERSLLEKDRVALQSKKSEIVAQINGLLHRSPSAPLPPPPKELAIAPLPNLTNEQWLEAAKKEQPELRAIDKMIAAKESAVKVAQSAYYPDFTVMATYSSMWPKLPHQFMLGFSINVPINLDWRDAKVEEAKDGVALAKSQYIQKVNDINVELQKVSLAYQQAVDQASIYKNKIIPSAGNRIEAAEAGYISGKVLFSDMLLAQRQLETFQRDYYEMIANTWKNRAKMLQIVGEIKLQNDSHTHSLHASKQEQNQILKDEKTTAKTHTNTFP